jgi:hypothetical protein
MQRHIITVDRKGWAWTIGWGVIASVVISFILSIALFFLFVMLIGGLGALGTAGRH